MTPSPLMLGLPRSMRQSSILSSIRHSSATPCNLRRFQSSQPKLCTRQLSPSSSPSLCSRINNNSSTAFTTNRLFSTTSNLSAKTIQQLRARSTTGPFSWKAAALFIVTGAGLIVYFQYEKARLERKRIVEMSKGVGKPKVGGPFVLRDLDGNEFTDENLKGKYNFVRIFFPKFLIQEVFS